jgi:hypothetical protein
MSFGCNICGYDVEAIAVAGRKWELRTNLVVVLPADMKLYTCEVCDEIYVTANECREIERLDICFAALETWLLE